MLEWPRMQQLLSKKWIDEYRAALYPDHRSNIDNPKEFRKQVINLMFESKLPPDVERIHTIWEMDVLLFENINFFYLLWHAERDLESSAITDSIRNKAKTVTRLKLYVMGPCQFLVDN